MLLYLKWEMFYIVFKGGLTNTGCGIWWMNKNFIHFYMPL